jgi:hypothetical protein
LAEHLRDIGFDDVPVGSRSMNYSNQTGKVVGPCSQEGIKTDAMGLRGTVKYSSWTIRLVRMEHNKMRKEPMDPLAEFFAFFLAKLTHVAFLFV